MAPYREPDAARSAEARRVREEAEAKLREVIRGLENERAIVRELEGLVGDLLQIGRRAAAALDRSAALKAERLVEIRAEKK